MGEAGDRHDVLDRVRELDPDVLLLDLRMPNLDGPAALQAPRKTNKRTRVIVLTASEERAADPAHRSAARTPGPPYFNPKLIRTLPRRRSGARENHNPTDPN